MKSGIYTIINQVNGKFYIGSAVNIKKRWTEHRRDLKKGIHGNKHLRRAWKKYGGENFYFGVLEPVKNKEDLLNKEQFWMDELHPEYNILLTAGSSLGFRWSEEQRQKISGENSPTFGKHRTKETKQKISETCKGMYCGEKNPMFGRTGEKHPMYGRTGENSPSYKYAKCYEYKGESKPLSDWAREYGFESWQIKVRVSTHGWSLERALLTPIRTKRNN